MRGDHLYARVEGSTDSYEISQMYWVEIAVEAAKRESKKLFVEERLEQQIPSIADTYQAAAERHEMGLAGIKIAFYDAFADQLADTGLQDFSVAKMAERAGVSVRTVYHHFPDRDALLDALDAEDVAAMDAASRRRLELLGFGTCVAAGDPTRAVALLHALVKIPHRNCDRRLRWWAHPQPYRPAGSLVPLRTLRSIDFLLSRSSH